MEQKNIEQKKTGYVLYDFMQRDLGLSGVALRVYALIYSFTKAGGDCHGSIEYIAKRTQSSRTSVYRGLDYLMAQGYITKLKLSPNRPCAYTANLNSMCQNGTPNDVTLSHDGTVTVSKWDGQCTTMVPNNKDNNKEDNKDNYLLTDNCCIDELRRIAIGDGAVRLTFRQYASLIYAIGVLPTINYIRTLDRQITTHPERTYPNHYKSILTWAREDYRLDCRDEEKVEAISERQTREARFLQKNEIS